MSDLALLKTIGEFIRHNRVNQNRTQEEVAKAANISRSTLSLLERGETVTLSTLLQVLRVLQLLHVMESFVLSQEISPVEYARLQKAKRQRAHKKSSDRQNDEETTW